MTFRSPYNFDSDVNSHHCGFSFDEDSDRTQQSFRDECDINTLVRVYANTGVIPGADTPAMVFNVDEIIDYQTALNRLMDADEAFMSFPSEIRDRFQNDPAVMLDFIHNADNRDEAIKLGLIHDPSPQEPVLVRLSEISSLVNPGVTPPDRAD